MPDELGPSLQTITDGRLTLKAPHREYLDNPARIDVSTGPGDSILLHSAPRRQALLAEVLGQSVGGALDQDQNQVEMRLDSMCTCCPVDEQGRLRLPEVLLELVGLTDKSCKVYIVPRRANGWLEVWPQESFKTYYRNPEDKWLAALNRLIERRREEQ